MGAAPDLRKLEILAMLVGRKRRLKALRARLALSAYLLTTLLIPAFYSNIYGQTSTAKGTNQAQLHGGIEIDPEGIKVAVIRISDTPQKSGAEVIFTEEFNLGLGKDQGGKFPQEVVKTVGRATRDYYTLIREQYKVPPQQIHLICSSDLDARKLEELVSEVKTSTGASITFLDVKSEAQLSVIGTVPKRYREGGTWFDNRSQSVVIDIGSYKTKGGYQQLRQPIVGDPYYEFVAIGIPSGTSSFTDEVNRAAGADAGINKFVISARALSESSVKAALRNELKKRPGLLYRKKIYLNGAIVGAMMTLLRPEDRQPIIAITVDDINTFYQQAVSSPQALLNPSLSRIRNEGVRKEVERELEVVKNTFTPKNIIAGAAIMKAMASECNFQEEGKKVLYARFSNMGSILSYLLLQAGEGPQP